jgi:heme/copper-type cytochrome/quinol oxidase subunit 1
MQFADFNAIASVGALCFGLAQVYFFLFIVLPTMRARVKSACKSPGKPLKAWNGKCLRPHLSTPSRPPQAGRDRHQGDWLTSWP